MAKTTGRHETIEETFDCYSEQGWTLKRKWELLTAFLDTHPIPADRTSENLQAFLLNVFDQECGFNDSDELDGKS